MTVAQGTRTSVLRARFQEFELDLESAAYLLAGLDDLLRLLGPRAIQVYADMDLEQPAIYPTREEAVRRARQLAQHRGAGRVLPAEIVLADSLVVRRISYNSPLEVLLYVGAASGTAGGLLAAAHQAIDLYSKSQNARVHKARADVVVLAADRLREVAGPQHMSRAEENRRVGRAANVLAALESLDFVDDEIA